ncbi:MAG: hypothetical protein ACRDG3_01695 [Tepidiformaceae bacterium]
MTNSTVGLNTAIDPLLDAALERFSEGQHGQSHIALAVCPEHVVDIYRERLPGVSMAWKLASIAR